MGFCTDQMLKEGFGETAGCVLQVVKCKLFVESCGISSMILFSPPWGWGGLNSSAEEGQKHFLLQPSFPLCFQQHAQSRNEMACYPLATLDSRSNKDVFQIMGYLPSYEIVPLECFTGTSHRLTTPVPLLQVPKHTSFLGFTLLFLWWHHDLPSHSKLGLCLTFASPSLPPSPPWPSPDTFT